MLRHFDFTKMRRRPRAAARIVNLFPLYDSLPTGEQYESYCRVKLMLHHLFTRIEDLREEFQGPDNRAIRVESYQEAYTLCTQHCNSHGSDPLDHIAEDALEEEEFEDQLDVEENPVERQAWEGFAERRAPNDGTRLEDPDNLGGRDMDRDFDWNANAVEYEQYPVAEDFLAIVKSEQLPEQDVAPLLSPDTLQAEQRKIFDAVMKQYEDELAEPFNRLPPLGLNGDGMAGTGKSYLIDLISRHLLRSAMEAGLPDPVQRCAPTGVAAYNIKGRTLHALLKLPVRKEFDKLHDISLATLQAKLKYCLFLIIDEKSMIGLLQLAWIDKRLRQIFPLHQDKSFGGFEHSFFRRFRPIASCLRNCTL